MLLAHPVAGKAKSKLLCEAFIAGAPRGAQGHVFWGVNETNADAWLKAQQRGEDWWYGDNSYFDNVRGQQFRWTKNRVQVNPTGRTSDGRRFAALGLTIKPWTHTSHGHVVVVEQSPSFMRTVAREPNWFHLALLEFERERLVVRGWHADKLKQQASLSGDLRGAKYLITHSSAAAVTAQLEGVMALVSPMSALHDSYLPHPDLRLHTMQVLSDNQFNINEMKSGEAWSCLNK